MAVNTTDIAALIQTVVAKSLTLPLQQASSFLSSGVSITDSSVPVSFPRLRGHFAPGWVGESELIPEDDGTEFDAVSLLPSTMKSVKSLVRLSNESLRQSSQSLDAVLQQRLITDVQAQLDTQAWSSGGNGTTLPKGVFHADNTENFARVDVNGTLTLDHLHDAYGRALSDDVPLSGLRWIMSPGQLTALRKVKDTSGRYIVTDGVGGAPAGLSLLGVPVTLSKRLATTGAAQTLKEQVLLMSPSTWQVVRDLSPQAVVDRSRYLEFDQTALRIVCRFDWGSLLPEANVLLTNVTPV
ncbi:phage major capsid protein [Microlunatus flavus]|uniref:Phage major capsid protein, HK97 family n=1 Tax=Microlunatus flavus TaxID=1036181 RepID=A0A1H9LKU8_9ACTN|nr:phage major capsid protein [Microlunatus flavus]SER12046.1 phage major capsid protein, HK97 family [Microlunatus flavus]